MSILKSHFRLFLVLALLLSFVLWGEVWFKQELGMGLEFLQQAKNQWGSIILIAGGLFYLLLLSLPFVPGVELGILLMCVFGKEGIVFVYFATLGGLSLAFAFGRLLPVAKMNRWLHRKGRSPICSGDSVRIEDMLEQSTLGKKLSHSRFGAYILKYRYLTLAILFNLPGNYVFGGGGGISLICGAGKHFQWKWFLLTIILATSPIPLLAFLGVIQLEALLG